MIFPGFIVGFREGLETFLLLALAFNYLKSLGAKDLCVYLWFGVGIGVVTSVISGFLLNSLVSDLSRSAKIWESLFSFLAVMLITTLIFWMIRHSKDMKSYVKNKLDGSMTKLGVTLFAILIVIREGAEIVLFSFAGNYSLQSILIGIFSAFLLSLFIYFSLVRVKLSVLFNLTLVYLILQAAYLLGYSVHEGLSAMKGVNLSEIHWLYAKPFDLSSGILNHKDGILGLPLNLILGWYSKPEWLAFILHYTYIIIVFSFWKKAKT
ncbi:MAG: high-affinity iron transporter [Oceanicoccus sp.]|jgi:high-affinity iron transporter